jgi:hypothetical protein
MKNSKQKRNVNAARDAKAATIVSIDKIIKYLVSWFLEPGDNKICVW